MIFNFCEIKIKHRYKDKGTFPLYIKDCNRLEKMPKLLCVVNV